MTSTPGSPPASPTGVPQGFQPAVPPPPRRSRRLRNIIIVVGILAVLCCAGVVTGGVFLFRGIVASNAPVRAAADTFVTDLQTGDYAGAYGLLCADTQAGFPQTTFTQVVQGQPPISSHRIVGSSVSNVNGRVSGQVTMELTLDTGSVARHVFVLVREGADWKVCGRPY